ncbi:MAG TPA: hypothetical protein ENH19_02155 [Actinobacteria bacterium]|nr:hypothetical protein [Actinomycetes bacterium]HEX21440.1 hypothetical protein [Actinomycetota bacterium]
MQTARRLNIETNASGLTLRTPRVNEMRFDILFTKAALMIFGIAALVFVYVYQQTLVTQNTMEIAELKEQISDVKTLNDKLKIQDVVLQSPERLEQLATDSLGMVKPKTVKYLVIPMGNKKNHSQPSSKWRFLTSLKKIWPLNGS